LRDVNRSWQLVASESSSLREFITQVVLGNKQVEGHMTRLRNLALGGLAALAVGSFASSAFAIEPGTFNYLAGASNGIPGGAAAPPGVYTGLTSVEGIYEPMTGIQGVTGGCASCGGLKLGAFIDVVPVVWSTGWNFLGASYSVAVIQPFVSTIVGPAGSNSVNISAGVGPTGVPGNSTYAAFSQFLINTVWQPINLSWNLGNGWFFSAAFSFQGPDGTMQGTPNPDYWTFEPGVGISYLSANWNVTANLAYSVYTASPGTNSAIGGTPLGVGYTNGNLFSGDTNALYKIGKWEIGPVADFEVQTSADSGGGTLLLPGGKSVNASASYNYQQTLYLGGFVGYDFGPVDIAVWVIDPVVANNTAQGLSVFSRVGFKVWGPEAPKPLVAKN
jgi:hypothetical protein